MSNFMDKQKISELLPFYVNGTLDDEERSEVSSALASDSELEAQARALSTVRDAFKTLDEPNHSAGEAGLERLMSEIDALDSDAKSGLIAANSSSAPSWIKWGGYGLAACFGALAMFVALPPASQDNFATQASGDVVLGEPEMTIAVVFAEEITVSDIAEILGSEGLVIVDGPSAIGVFRLADQNGNEITLSQADRLRNLTSVFSTVDDPS